MARRPPFFLGYVLLGGVLVASAAAGCAAQSTTGDTDKIQATNSIYDVSVKNLSGRALVEVRVEIHPAGHSTVYSSRLPRIENGEERSIGFTLFTDKDNVPFSPRTAKPVAIAVKAKDIDGKDIAVEVPWKKK
jgi:hypothetical protein